MRRGQALTNFNDGMWRRMKSDAIERADLRCPMPAMEECVEHIGQIAKTTPPWNLPTEARDFYAREFYTMIVVERQRGAQASLPHSHHPIVHHSSQYK